MELSGSKKRLVAEVFKSDYRFGRVARFFLTGWIIVSLFIACDFSEHYVLLVQTYGFSRIHREGLHFTYIPSSKSADDYIVSNGDHISGSHRAIAFPVAVLVWLAFVIVGYLAIKYVSRRRSEVVCRESLNRIYDDQ